MLELVEAGATLDFLSSLLQLEICSTIAIAASANKLSSLAIRQVKFFVCASEW